MFILFILLFYLSVYPLDSSDSLLVLNGKSAPVTLPWMKIDNVTPTNIRTSSDAAIIGNAGMERSLNYNSSNPGFYFRAPYLSDSWERFYFRVDRYSVDKKAVYPKDLVIDMSLCSYSFSERVKREYLQSFIVFSVQYHMFENRLTLQWRSQTPKDKSTTPLEYFHVPMEKKKVYCIESHVSFFRNDSVQVEFYINGLLSGSTKSGYYSGHDLIEAVIPTHHMFLTKAVIPDSEFSELLEQCSLMVALDGFSISKERPFTSPPKPAFCQSIVNSKNKHELSCNPFESDYQNETQTETRWRVFPESDRIFPVFDDIDPAFFHGKTIPFSLDSGLYLWQVKFRNNFDEWGQWSEPCTIKVKKQRPSKVGLKNVYIKLLHKPFSAQYRLCKGAH